MYGQALDRAGAQTNSICEKKLAIRVTLTHSELLTLVFPFGVQLTSGPAAARLGLLVIPVKFVVCSIHVVIRIICINKIFLRRRILSDRPVSSSRKKIQ